MNNAGLIIVGATCATGTLDVLDTMFDCNLKGSVVELFFQSFDCSLQAGTLVAIVSAPSGKGEREHREREQRGRIATGILFTLAIH